MQRDSTDAYISSGRPRREEILLRPRGDRWLFLEQRTASLGISLRDCVTRTSDANLARSLHRKKKRCADEVEETENDREREERRNSARRVRFCGLSRPLDEISSSTGFRLCVEVARRCFALRLDVSIQLAAFHRRLSVHRRPCFPPPFPFSSKSLRALDLSSALPSKRKLSPHGRLYPIFLRGSTSLSRFRGIL